MSVVELGLFPPGPDPVVLRTRWLNAILAVVLLALTGVLGWQLSQRTPDVDRLRAAVAERRVRGPITRSVTPFAPREDYLAQARARDVFGVADRAPETADRPAADAQVDTTLPDLLKRLELKGILLSPETKVVLHHKGEGKTYFLRPGQRVPGTDVTVQGVENGQVIFRYREQEARL